MEKGEEQTAGGSAQKKMKKHFLSTLWISVAFCWGGVVQAGSENPPSVPLAKKAPCSEETDLMERVIRLSKTGTLPCPLSPQAQQNALLRLIRTIIQRTLTSSPHLKSIREAYWKDFGGLALAKGEFLPDLGVEVRTEVKRNRANTKTTHKNESPYTFDSDEENVRSESAEAALTLSQNLFNGGGSLAKVRQARLNNKVAYENYRLEEGQELFDHIKVMLQVINDQILLQHRKADVAINEAFLKAVLEKMKTGEADRGEVALAQSKLEKAKMKLYQTTMDFEEHAGDLERWTGLKPEELIPAFPDLDSFLPPTEAEAEKIAEVQSPTLRKNRYEALSKKAEITVQKTGWSPRLDLTASAGASRTHDHNKAKGLGGWREHDLDQKSGTDLSVGLTFSMPLDLKGTTRIGVAGAHHDYVSAVAAGDRDHGDVIAAISGDWDKLEPLRQTIAASKRNVQANFHLLQNALQEISVGAKVYAQALTAQSDFMEAIESLLDAQLRYALSVLSILLNMGQLNASTFGVSFSDPLIAPAHPRKSKPVFLPS